MNNALIFKILRWSCVLIALIFLISLCTDSDGDTAASFDELQTAVSMQADTSLVQLADAQKIERFYGLNAEEFANCLLYLPTDSVVYVEEILLIECKDEAQKEAVLSAIEARLDTQKKTFENYNMFGQYEKLCDKAFTEVRGNFILFVINCDAAHQAFLNTI